MMDTEGNSPEIDHDGNFDCDSDDGLKPTRCSGK